MKPAEHIGHSWRTMSVIVLTCAMVSGCQTPQENWALGGGLVGVGLAGRTPTHEIQQIYYLGIFDPQEQVPPSVYRVRVHGQASFLSLTKFASGWVPAKVIDSLGTDISFEKEGYGVTMTKGDESMLSSLKTGRRLVLFGPEGFREAPKDHRLVIVMGASPEKFFEGIDQSLGQVSRAAAELRNSGLNGLLFEALVSVKAERERLEDLAQNVQSEMPESKAVTR